jgi:hypothetical protein
MLAGESGFVGAIRLTKSSIYGGIDGQDSAALYGGTVIL